MKKKYHLGIIVSRIDFGAAELLEMNLAIELSKLGHNVVLMPQHSKDKFDDGAIEQKIVEYDLKLQRLFFDKPFKCFREILKIRKLNLDFVISHNRGGDLLGSAICLFTKTKDIKAMHEYYFKSNINSVMNYLWKLSFKNANYTYHISTNVLNINRKTFNLSSSKSKVVYNAIHFLDNVEEFKLKEIGVPINKKIVLTVARVVENKGHHNNLDIVIPLLQKRDDFIYLIAGENISNPNLYAELLERVKKENLSEKVFYLGQISNTIGLMKKSSCLLHFAKHEGFGLVLLEAMNENLPIIASDVGGISEVLQDTKFKPLSLSQKDTARALLNEYLSNNEKIENDIETLKEKFSHENRAKSIVTIFEQI